MVKEKLISELKQIDIHLRSIEKNLANINRKQKERIEKPSEKAKGVVKNERYQRNSQ